MEFQVVIPVLISFAISVVLGPVIIPFLRRLKMGQTERTEGVQSHLKKAGTPTMGGVIFLIATAITALFYVGDYPKIIPVLFLTLGFGIIGFLDDYLKVVLKRSDGLLPWQKFLLQVVLTAIFVFYIVKYTDISLTMRIPFWSGSNGRVTIPNDWWNTGYFEANISGKEFLKRYSFNFEGNGFRYLLQELMIMIRDKRTECTRLFYDESVRIIEILETINRKDNS